MSQTNEKTTETERKCGISKHEFYTITDVYKSMKNAQQQDT